MYMLIHSIHRCMCIYAHVQLHVYLHILTHTIVQEQLYFSDLSFWDQILNFLFHCFCSPFSVCFELAWPSQHLLFIKHNGSVLYLCQKKGYTGSVFWTELDLLLNLLLCCCCPRFIDHVMA